MKKQISALIALLLCLCVLLAGCNAKEKSNEPTTDTNTESAFDNITSGSTEESENVDNTVTSDEITTKQDNTSSANSATVKPTQISSPTITIPETVPAPVKKDVDSYKWNHAGVYEVGSGKNMLVPGEYYIVRTTSKSASVSLINKKFGRYVENSYLITLKSGDKVYLDGCKIIHSSVEHPHEDSNGIYQPGIYKVGRDIPADEYIYRVVSNKKSPGVPGFTHLSSSAITTFGDLHTIVKSFGYITAKEGQYIKLYGCTLEKVTSKPIYDKSTSLKYPQGMYKVGKDIPAGYYKFNSAGSKASYILYKDSLYNESSIIKSYTSTDSIFSKPFVINLKEGQYIHLDNSYLTDTPSIG